jgi:iron complex transport system ATP-binding protein
MSLVARDLAFGFARQPVGEGLDLELKAGTVWCLLGPNGSGKTTLLRTLLGLLAPLRGEVLVDDVPILALSARERARKLAYVPQASEGDLEFSVEEIVAMGRVAHGGLLAGPSVADRQATHAALDRLGLMALAERPLGELSGGERQLALIARALATEAALFIMDEPTANLDFANQARVLRQIAGLREAGVGVLFTTHHPDHALRAADHALLLKDGRVQAQGASAATLNSRNLSALYGCAIDVVDIPLRGGATARACIG